jgi:hypothetical protein
LKKFLVDTGLPVENYLWVDFSKRSYPPSSFRDYDESTGTSALHAELQRGLLSVETVGRVLGTAPPNKYRKLKRS